MAVHEESVCPQSPASPEQVTALGAAPWFLAFRWKYGTLGIAFVVLKLCGVVDWSWLWVLAPFWIPTVVVVVLVAILAATGGSASAWKTHR